MDPVTVYQPGAYADRPGNGSELNTHAVPPGDSRAAAAPGTPDSPSDTFGSQDLNQKKNHEPVPSGLKEFIRGLNPFREPATHQALPDPPAHDPAPLDTTTLWQEVSALTQSSKGTSATTSLPAALSAESQEKLALLLCRLNAQGVRFGSGTRKSLTAGTMKPEDLAARLSLPGQLEPCWVEGPDFRQRPCGGSTISRCWTPCTALTIARGCRWPAWP